MIDTLKNAIASSVYKLLNDYTSDVEEALSANDKLTIAFSAKIKPLGADGNDISVKMSFAKFKVEDAVAVGKVQEQMNVPFPGNIVAGEKDIVPVPNERGLKVV